MPFRCCICKKEGKENVHLFALPKNKEIRKKWVQFCGIEEDKQVTYSSYRVCGAHFQEVDIRKLYPRPLLKPGAFPTLKSVDESTSKDVVSINKQRQGVCTSVAASPRVEASPSMEASPSVEASPSMEASPSVEASPIVEASPSMEASPSVEASPIVEASPSMEASPSVEDMDCTRSVTTPSTAFSTPMEHVDAQDPTTSTKILSPCTGRRLSTTTTKIKQYRRIINMYRMRYIRLNALKQKATLSRKQVIEQTKSMMSPAAHALFSMQLQLRNCNKSGYRFSNEVKDIALSIFYHSPKTYRFLSKIMTLPSIRTLHMYQSRFPIYPGLNFQLMHHLKLIFNKKPIEHRIVSLVFDEIHLNQEIHYDPGSDLFIGVSDDGDARIASLAKTALVLQIVWITKKMKQTIGYYLLPSKAQPNQLKKIILNAIDALQESNIIVKCIVCDQAPNNRSVFKNLILTPEPNFVHNSIKIHCIYDCPHLLKSLRNNLLTNDMYYNNNVTSWTEITSVFNCSKIKKLHLIPRITEQHLMLTHFSKMKVRFAAQIFSASMHTAMLCYQTIFPEQFCITNSSTAQFIYDIDRLFDTVNSNLLRKSAIEKMNFAITKDSGHIEFIQKMIQSFKNIKFIKKPNPPCIKGWILSLESIVNLFNDLTENYNIPYLQTRRLNQDSLENLFAVIRQQHGCNANPSVQKFQAGIRHLLITQISKISSTTNCEADMDCVVVQLSKLINAATNENMSREVERNNERVMESADETVLNVENSPIADFTENNAIFYIAGYIGKKFVNAHSCQACSEIIFDKTNISNIECIFTLFKNVDTTSGLKFVNKQIFETMKDWEGIFNRSFSTTLTSNAVTYLLPILKNCDSPISLCSTQHNEIFIKLYIRIRCHWEARFIRNSLSSKTVNSKYKKFL